MSITTTTSVFDDIVKQALIHGQFDGKTQSQSSFLLYRDGYEVVLSFDSWGNTMSLKHLDSDEKLKLSAHVLLIVMVVLFIACLTQLYEAEAANLEKTTCLQYSATGMCIIEEAQDGEQFCSIGDAPDGACLVH